VANQIDPLHSLLYMIQGLKHDFSSEKIADFEFCFFVDLFPSLDDFRYLFGPVLSDHVHYINDSELMVSLTG